MQTLKRIFSMSDFTAGDLNRILSVLINFAEPEGADVPLHHRGICVHLSGRSVEFVAVRHGQTTRAVMYAEHFIGAGSFFLDHNELDSLRVILSQDEHEPVCITRDAQPLTHLPCILVTVGDWYTGYHGISRVRGFPRRSLSGSGRAATTEEIKNTTMALSRLDSQNNVRVKLSANLKETILTVLQPIPSLVSVSTHLY